MQEGTHLLFMMLVILATIWLIRDRKRIQFIVFGLTAGFAVAAKHPNVVIITLLFFASGSHILLQWMQQKISPPTARKFIMGLVISGLISLATFYALNPAWWEKPTQAAQEVIRMRSGLINRQTDTFENFGLVYHSMADKLDSFFDVVFVTKIDSFLRIRPHIVKIYEDSYWGGVPIGGTSQGGLIVIGLVIFGFIHMWRNPAILPEFRWLISVWSIGIIVFSFATVPFRIVRYYIPVAPVIGILLAYSVVTISIKLWQILLSRRAKLKTP